MCSVTSHGVILGYKIPGLEKFSVKLIRRQFLQLLLLLSLLLLLLLNSAIDFHS